MFRLAVVFGLGFIMPVIVVTLNLMGVVSTKALASARPYVLFGTRRLRGGSHAGGDPFSMLALAIDDAAVRHRRADLQGQRQARAKQPRVSDLVTA